MLQALVAAESVDDVVDLGAQLAVGQVQLLDGGLLILEQVVGSVRLVLDDWVR